MNHVLRQDLFFIRSECLFVCGWKRLQVDEVDGALCSSPVPHPLRNSLGSGENCAEGASSSEVNANHRLDEGGAVLKVVITWKTGRTIR